MVISPQFKEEIPSIQSLQSISESYPKSDLLSKSVIGCPILTQPIAVTGAERGIVVTAGVTAPSHRC
jgi:hypothetical protein